MPWPTPPSAIIIDARQDEPFFPFLSFLEPRFQNQVDDYPPPDGCRERYNGAWTPPDPAALGGSTHQHIAGCYGTVKRIDEALGRLPDALKSLDLSENTIVVFTPGHGCHFKTRNSEYERSRHDSSIRVPTAITGPGFLGGGRVQQLVSILDLPPPLPETCGLPVPETMMGRSVLCLLRGETQNWPEEVLVQISESQVAREVRTHRWKYCVVAPDKDPGAGAGSDRYREEYRYDQ